MAIDINSVYKEVLNIIKNEDVEKGYESSQRSFVRRPYLTPEEFNQFAERAQLDIFENYLTEYKKAVIIGDEKNKDLFRHKLSGFKSAGVDVDKTTGAVSGDTNAYVERIYDSANGVKYEEVSRDYFEKVKAYSSSKAFLTATNPKNHIYYKHLYNTMVFHPTPTANPDAEVIKYPNTPKWGYNVDNNTVTSDSTTTVNFLLNEDDRGTLVNKILEMAGTSYRDTQVADLSLRNESTNKVNKIQ